MTVRMTIGTGNGPRGTPAITTRPGTARATTVAVCLPVHTHARTLAASGKPCFQLCRRFHEPTIGRGCQDAPFHGLCPGVGAAHERILQFCGFLFDRLYFGGCFALVVALCLGQIGSVYPTAGGLYHWSSIFGGRGWGWATAWFNLIGLLFVVASVNVGVWYL